MKIQAEFYNFPIRGYRSFAAAVRAGLASPQARRARAESIRLAGSTIIDACWDEAGVAFRLSNGFILHIFNNGTALDWLLISDDDYLSLRAKLKSPDDHWTVQYVTSDGVGKGVEREFSRSEVATACIGKTVRRITIREVMLTLQFEGQGWYVFFTPVKGWPAGQPLLIWTEDKE